MASLYLGSRIAKSIRTGEPLDEHKLKCLHCDGPLDPLGYCPACDSPEPDLERDRR